MKLSQYVFLFFVLSILTASTSCVIRQEALLRPDGSGAVSFDFKVEPYFIDTAREMAELSSEGGLPEGDIFNIPKIREDFAEKDEVVLREVESTGTGRLEGYFTFEDISKVFASQEELTEAGIISLTSSGENTIMRVRLNKRNYGQISTLFPVVDNPLFEMFGPQEGEDITEEEYVEMVELAFGEASARGLRRSSIELKVDIEGTVVGQTGGRIQGKSVIFKIPLIKVLLLDEPLEYTIEFR
ncbi:MAG: hypothetical protein ACLFRY_08645 [Spirochaetia bacterium]